MYAIDLANIIAEIRKGKARRVMLQLPDGLKPRAQEFSDEITKATGAEVLVWAGSCYGACDIPQCMEKLGVDLLFHFGHTPWRT